MTNKLNTSDQHIIWMVLFSQVLTLFSFNFQNCVRRLSSGQNAQIHYKAVCRALATEATELLTFLDNIARGQEVYRQNKKFKKSEQTHLI